MAQPDINYLAVLVAGIISMFIGFLWYGPLFGKSWMKLMNFTKKNIKSMKMISGTAYFFGFIAALLMNYVLAFFVDYADATSFGLGMQVGFWVWLGFFAPIMLGIVLWENKPFKLYLLNIFHYLVVLLINAGLLAVWV